MIFKTLRAAIIDAENHLRNNGEIVSSVKWQGIHDEGREMFECMNVHVEGIIPLTPEELQHDVSANQPWAENHFKERIGGIPLNPGNEYKNWPFYPKDDSKIKPSLFTHTYMERFWPKYANKSGCGGREDLEIHMDAYKFPHQGIRYDYGDLEDVIQLLCKEPYTRQAYLPIWFPEDTGVVHGLRVPCTLGYLFFVRNNMLHCNYYIRSCDYLRHFRDDIYLTGRLVQYITQRIQDDMPHDWSTKLRPGLLNMYIGSFHIFAKEMGILLKNK